MSFLKKTFKSKLIFLKKNVVEKIEVEISKKIRVDKTSITNIAVNIELEKNKKRIQ